MHRHDFHQIMFVICGKGNVVINDAQYSVSAGSLVCIRPGISHCFTFPSKNKCLCRVYDLKIYLPGAAAERLTAQPCITHPDPVLAGKTFELLAEAVRSGRTISDETLHGLINWLIGVISKDSGTGGRSVRSGDARILKAADTIEEAFIKNPSSIPDVKTLAVRAGMERSYFIRIFKSVFGETPAQFITLRRLDRGKNLVAFSSVSLKDAAVAAGFSTYHHFSNLFTRVYGMRPAAYRKRHGYDRFVV